MVVLELVPDVVVELLELVVDVVVELLEVVPDVVVEPLELVPDVVVEPPELVPDVEVLPEPGFFACPGGVVPTGAFWAELSAAAVSVAAPPPPPPQPARAIVASTGRMAALKVLRKLYMFGHSQLPRPLRDGRRQRIAYRLAGVADTSTAREVTTRSASRQPRCHC